MDYVPANDIEVKALIRKAQAQASVSMDDVANGESHQPILTSQPIHTSLRADDDDDEPGSGSGSGSDDE